MYPRFGFKGGDYCSMRYACRNVRLYGAVFCGGEHCRLCFSWRYGYDRLPSCLWYGHRLGPRASHPPKRTGYLCGSLLSAWVICSAKGSKKYIPHRKATVFSVYGTRHYHWTICIDFNRYHTRIDSAKLRLYGTHRGIYRNGTYTEKPSDPRR